MTRDEAEVFLGMPAVFEHRTGATIVGKIVGIVEHPSVILEMPEGERVVYAVDTLRPAV
jgi:hypothetical protein